MKLPQRLGPIHFIGIGGIGMSGIAEVMHNLGYTVQGSDAADNYNVKRLADKGIRTFIGHKAENVEDAEIVVVSTAIKRDNPELALARENHVPVFHIRHGAGAGAPAFATDSPFVEFLPEVAPQPGETVLWKSHADAFLGTGLAERIRETGREELIIAGDTTGVCVSTSTRTAYEAHGFRVTVVADATATRDVPNPLGGVIPAETVRQAALADLADGFATVVKNADAWR